MTLVLMELIPKFISLATHAIEDCGGTPLIPLPLGAAMPAPAAPAPPAPPALLPLPPPLRHLVTETDIGAGKMSGGGLTFTAAVVGFRLELPGSGAVLQGLIFGVCRGQCGSTSQD